MSRRQVEVIFGVMATISTTSEPWATAKETPRAKYASALRTWTYSALLALPVMVLYEVGVLGVDRALGVPVRNGADALLRSLASMAGPLGMLGLPVVVALVLGFKVWRERATNPVPVKQSYLAFGVGEAVLYAAFFGGVVGRLTAMVLPGVLTHLDAAQATTLSSLPRSAQVILSLGAGFYEEVLFRGLLLGLLRWGLSFFGGFKPFLREGIAVLLGAFLFSAYHYVGASGDPFQVSTFTFRFLSGLVFSGLLVTRGFGITVLTHAFYDVFFSLGLV
jgi:membrane protease YdiL (CAAX protease family)